MHWVSDTKHHVLLFCFLNSFEILLCPKQILKTQCQTQQYMFQSRYGILLFENISFIFFIIPIILLSLF